MPDDADNDSANLGFGGWYDPRRLAWALPRRLRRWAPLLAIAGAMLGIAIGLVSMQSTWRLHATLRLVPAAQSLHVEASLDPYRVPEFHPEEVQSWFHRTNVYERLQQGLHRPEPVDELKRMFSITFDRESSLFEVEVSGAPTAKDAESLLSYYCNVVIDEAKQQVRTRIRADEDYYRRKLTEETSTFIEAKDRLSAFVKTNDFVGLETEASLRKNDLVEARNAVANAEARLAALHTRKGAIPTLLASLPTEVPGGRTLRTAREQKLDELRGEERRLSAIYTDSNPQLIAVRAQIVALEMPEDAAHPPKPDSMMPNPSVSMLQQEMTTIDLNEPQTEKDLETAKARLALAEQRVASLPPLASQYQDLSIAVGNGEQLLKRVQARLAEIEIVGGLQGGQLQVSDSPNAAYANERAKALKVALCAFAGAFLGVGFGCLVAAFEALRDPFLRGEMDFRLVLKAREVERMPAPPAEIADHRLWLQRTSEFVTGSAKSALLVPSAQARDSALVARALAEQIARSGLKTLLVADAALLGLPPAKGLSHVLDREIHPEQALVELAERLSLFGVGDLPRLLDQASSGNLERLIAELGSHFDFLLVAPPVGEVALLRRLSQSLASVIVVVGPGGQPRASAEEIERLQRPVALVLYE